MDRQKREIVFTFSQNICIFPNLGKERSDLPATFIAAKFLLEMCIMTLRVDWYLYRVFTINIKGARAILVKKSDLPGFDQKHYNTTYSDLSRNTTIRLISQKAQEGYFALTVEILRLDFTTILHFHFEILTLEFCNLICIDC